MKRCGVISGVPDLCIPLPSGPYHGLYIELKRIRGGIVSDTQLEWIKYLHEQNYYAEIVRGCDEAKEIILRYLAFTPKAA